MAIADTILTITGMGIPPYSARGLTQTLKPIAESVHLERAVNGSLIDLSAPQFRKYESKITCTDQETPAIDGIWPGMVLTINCVAQLTFPVSNPAAQSRPEVPGSLVLSDDGNFYSYCPVLTMIVKGIDTSTEEWKAEVVWSLDLEEQ